MTLDALLIRSLLIVLVGLTVALLQKKRAAATRHLVYAGTLFSLVLLPVLRQWAPTHVLPVESLPAPVRNLAATIESAPAPTFTLPTIQGHVASIDIGQFVIDGLIVAWGLGCLGLIVRLFVGVILTAQLVKRSERLYLFGSEAYEIRVAEGVLVPATTWIGRQVIILPATYDSWPSEQVRSVVLHEAAHIARRDWFVQFFGRVACALYWPNPLVWLANRRMVEAAEQAADDLVLQAGVTPSRYAEDLLQIARTVRTNQPALTIPMAIKNDVGRRIEMVLDNNKRRGSVHLGGLGLAALGIAAVTIPAASLLLHTQAEVSTRQYADLQNRKSVAGTEANGFVGRLGDGRKVELLQVSWYLPDGTLQAWRPNGALIALRDQYRRVYHGPDEKDRMDFVYRLQAGGELVHAGMDLANESRTSSRGETFGEGVGLPRDKDGNMIVEADMAVRHHGVADPTSFVFYIADGASMTAASYVPATGAIKDNPDFPEGLTVDPEAVAHPVEFGANGVILTGPDGQAKRKDVPATLVTFNYAPNPMYFITDAVGIERSGKVVQASHLRAKRTKDGTTRITDWFPRSADLARIEVQLHDLHAVEMRGVHIRPNTVVSP